MAIRISRRLIGMTAAHVAVALDRARSAPAVTVRVRVSRAISPYDDRSTTPLRVLLYATVAFLSPSVPSASPLPLAAWKERKEKKHTKDRRRASSRGGAVKRAKRSPRTPIKEGSPLRHVAVTPGGAVVPEL